jgi:O-antigen/teichoic acid export membrane protein
MNQGTGKSIAFLAVTLSSQVLGVFSIILSTRLLGVDQFADLTRIMVAAGVSVPLVGLGLIESALLLSRPEHEAPRPQLTGSIVALGTISAISAGSLAIVLYRISHNGGTNPLLIFVYAASSGFLVIPMALDQASGRIWRIALTGIVVPASFIAGIILILLTSGHLTVERWLILRSTIQLAATCVRTFPHMRINGCTWSTSVTRTVLKTGLDPYSSGLLATISSRADQVVAQALLRNQHMAMYGVIMSAVGGFRAMGSSLSTVVAIHLTSAHHRVRSQLMIRYVSRVALGCSILAVFASVAMTTMLPFIVPNLTFSGGVIVAFCLAASFEVVATTIIRASRILNVHGVGLWARAAQMFTSLPLCWMLGRSHGLMGVGVGALIGSAVLLAVAYAFAAGQRNRA